jgi:CheY-like chemotaxis protein
MPQVFISYASQDAIFADLAKMKLLAANIQVWLDQGAVRAGAEWRKAIDEGISTSHVVLVVITPSSCKSAYVTYEWAFALGSGVKVIPVLRKGNVDDLHPRLAVLQYLDFRDPKALPWMSLFKEIEESTTDSKDKASTHVRDLSVDQLHEIIVGAVSLAAAAAKTHGMQPSPNLISRVAESIVGGMQNATMSEPIGDSARHILWVDDRPHNNNYERGALESIGFRFVLALSTNEALQILSRQQFAAIISDMGRNEGPREGYALLDALRSRGDRTPFFIYAGSNAPKHKREAIVRGAQGSTNDPQELFELVTQMRREKESGTDSTNVRS